MYLLNIILNKLLTVLAMYFFVFLPSHVFLEKIWIPETSMQKRLDRVYYVHIIDKLFPGVVSNFKS